MNDWISPPEVSDRRVSHNGRVPRTHGGPYPRSLSAGGEQTALARLVRRRYRLIAIVAAITVIPGVYLALREQPAYTAQALIRIADVRSTITGGREAREQSLGPRTDAIRSNLEIIRGWDVVGEVVDREGLRFAFDPVLIRSETFADIYVAPAAPGGEIHLQFSDSVLAARMDDSAVVVQYSAPVEIGAIRFLVAAKPEVESATVHIRPRTEAIAALQKRIKVQQLDRTDLVAISYSAATPELAQRVTNSIVEVFQESSARHALQRSQRRRLFLEEQVRGTDSLLLTVQVALSAFRNREQVYSSRDKLAAQQQSLMSLDIRREEMIADRRMYESLFAALQRPEQRPSQTLRTLVSSPGISANPVVLQLHNMLVQYETEREALTAGPTGSTAENPAVVRLDGLIAATQRNLTDAISSHVASLDARIKALDDLRSRTATGMRQLPGSEAEELRLVQQLDGLSKMSGQLHEELHNARMTEAVEAGQVEIANLAPLPVVATSRRTLKLALVAVLGLVCGVSSALVLESKNTSIRRRDELERVLELPSLAVIPQISPRPAGKLQAMLPTRIGRYQPDGRANLPGSAIATGPGLEAYRTLRTNLIFSHGTQAPRTLMVTSAAPGEGKSTTAANMAIAFARSGANVLLIDCDFHRPQLHERFGISNRAGLAEILRHEAQPDEVIHAARVDKLFFLSTGKVRGIFDHFSEVRMKAVLEYFADSFDLVVLDTPPLLGAADAAMLAPLVEGVVLVVRAGSTDRAAVQYAAQQLEIIGTRVLGAVLNDPDAVLPVYDEQFFKDYYYSDV